MKMYIKATEFLGILGAYYSELFGHEVKVESECYHDIEGYGLNAMSISKVRFSYETEIKIYNHTVTQTNELSTEDIKDAFSKILEQYDVENIRNEVCESDRYNSSLDFIGVELTLREKQKHMRLRQ